MIFRRETANRRSRAVLLLAGALMMATACSDDDDSTSADDADQETPEAPTDDQRFPDVVDVEVDRSGDAYDFDVTISSPYDTPDRYADGWRIKGGDGTVYGEHELAHDHADEQPFTRTQEGVVIDDEVDEVIVEGRDLDNGYGGETMTVALPDS